MVNNSSGTNTSGNLFSTSIANATSLAADATGQIIAGGGGGGGNYTLISTQTAANSAFVIFTSIPNTYNRFQLMFDLVQPISSGGQFYLQISTDNGATYQSTNYTSGTNQFSIASGSWSSSQTTGGMLLTDAIAAGNQDVQGTVFLHSFTSGVGFPGLEGISSGNSGTIFGSIILMAYYNIPGAVINAIRIGNSAGNIDTGIFSLYGISQ